jgi:nucleoside 2-deoxyribosyltransferase
MNIYFACSITGGRDFEGVYQDLTRALLADGHNIPTAHLAAADVMKKEAAIDPRLVYKRDTAWINACDVLIAEVSVPSHGVGYEIGFALERGKPVLCLYRVDRKVSKMITGNPHPKLRLRSYGETAGAIALAREFIAEAAMSLPPNFTTLTENE